MKIETNPSFKYNIAIFVFLQLIVQVSAFTSRTQFSTIPTFIGFKVRESANLSHSTVSPIKMASKEDNEEQSKENKEPHISNVLFIECGFGNDSHGQSATKAAVRACRNAIEFNSIPSINRLVPGGYDKLKLSVILAVPPKYQEGLDLEAVAKVFPYGETEFIIQDGGMIAPSGIAIDKLGDTCDDMVVVCASVTVGY